MTKENFIYKWLGVCDNPTQKEMTRDLDLFFEAELKTKMEYWDQRRSMPYNKLSKHKTP